MSSSLPSPVAAALGVVPAVAAHLRALPGRAVQLPVLALSGALTTAASLRREYDDLAERGERLVGRWRGEAEDAADDVAQRADDLQDRLARTPFAPARDKAAAAADKANDAVRDLARADGAAATRDARKAGASVAAAAQDVVDGVREQTPPAREQQLPMDEQPKGAPTPKATEPGRTRVDTAATPDVVAVVEQVAGSAEVLLEHDDLPLPDYDHMTLGSLRGRLRSLSSEQLVQIRTYEKAHADRLPIITMLDNRIAKLATEAAAEPDGAAQLVSPPELTPTPTGSKVSPATTNAPPSDPPSQGVPTNPSQPR